MLLIFFVKLTFDHSSMSISPAVVLIITRPFVGRAIEELVFVITNTKLLPYSPTHWHFQILYHKPSACPCFARGGGLRPPPRGSHTWGKIFSSTILQCILTALIIIIYGWRDLRPLRILKIMSYIQCIQLNIQLSIISKGPLCLLKIMWYIHINFF